MGTYYVCRLKDTQHYFAATKDGDGNYVYTDTSEVVAPEWIAQSAPYDTIEYAEQTAAFLEQTAQRSYW